jgi:RNA polymerase sigma-70 factor (ECF subfamily)
MEDLDLIDAILNGDKRSFEILFYRYEKEISKYIYAYVKNISETEDIVQEVFISVYNKLFTFKSGKNFRPWLYAIARNKTIDYLRKSKKAIFVDIDDRNIKITEQEYHPEDMAEFKETKAIIENFIKILSFKNREVLYLKYYNQDMTFSQLAQILNISEGAAKRRYYSIYKKYISYIKKNKTLGGDNSEV